MFSKGDDGKKDPIKIEEEEELGKKTDQEICAAVDRPVDCAQMVVDEARRQQSVQMSQSSDFRQAQRPVDNPLYWILVSFAGAFRLSF